MPITNEQLQTKLMDALSAIDSAELETKALAEIVAVKAALTTAKQKLDRVGPPPVLR
ncbi:MAG: hypothetical protein ACXW14_01235 [Burkholderiaceae bacterium]